MRKFYPEKEIKKLIEKISNKISFLESLDLESLDLESLELKSLGSDKFELNNKSINQYNSSENEKSDIKKDKSQDKQTISNQKNELSIFFSETKELIVALNEFFSKQNFEDDDNKKNHHKNSVEELKQRDNYWIDNVEFVRNLISTLKQILFLLNSFEDLIEVKNQKFDAGIKREIGNTISKIYFLKEEVKKKINATQKNKKVEELNLKNNKANTKSNATNVNDGNLNSNNNTNKSNNSNGISVDDDNYNYSIKKLLKPLKNQYEEHNDRFLLDGLEKEKSEHNQEMNFPHFKRFIKFIPEVEITTQNEEILNQILDIYNFEDDCKDLNEKLIDLKKLKIKLESMKKIDKLTKKTLVVKSKEILERLYFETNLKTIAIESKVNASKVILENALYKSKKIDQKTLKIFKKIIENVHRREDYFFIRKISDIKSNIFENFFNTKKKFYKKINLLSSNLEKKAHKRNFKNDFELELENDFELELEETQDFFDIRKNHEAMVNFAKAIEVYKKNFESYKQNQTEMVSNSKDPQTKMLFENVENRISGILNGIMQSTLTKPVSNSVPNKSEKNTKEKIKESTKKSVSQNGKKKTEKETKKETEKENEIAIYNNSLKENIFLNLLKIIEKQHFVIENLKIEKRNEQKIKSENWQNETFDKLIMEIIIIALGEQDSSKGINQLERINRSIEKTKQIFFTKKAMKEKFFVNEIVNLKKERKKKNKTYYKVDKIIQNKIYILKDVTEYFIEKPSDNSNNPLFKKNNDKKSQKSECNKIIETESNLEKSSKEKSNLFAVEELRKEGFHILHNTTKESSIQTYAEIMKSMEFEGKYPITTHSFHRDYSPTIIQGNLKNKIINFQEENNSSFYNRFDNSNSSTSYNNISANNNNNNNINNNNFMQYNSNYEGDNYLRNQKNNPSVRETIKFTTENKDPREKPNNSSTYKENRNSLIGLTLKSGLITNHSLNIGKEKYDSIPAELALKAKTSKNSYSELKTEKWKINSIFGEKDILNNQKELAKLFLISNLFTKDEKNTTINSKTNINHRPFSLSKTIPLEIIDKTSREKITLDKMKIINKIPFETFKKAHKELEPLMKVYNKNNEIKRIIKYIKLI